MSDGPTMPSDPSARLEKTFRKVAVRIEGLGFVNSALEVEAVAFAPWEGHWLGVMLTPWFMNLTLLPRDPDCWHSLRPGEKRCYRFPAGIYEFIGASDPEIGDFKMCSLFSPVLQFDDHASARRVAQLARDALLDPRHAEPAAALATGARDATGPGMLRELRERIEAPMSKRDFLRGSVLGAERESPG